MVPFALQDDLNSDKNGMKKFSKWAIHEVEREFQVIPVEPHPLLTAWLVAELPITTEEDEELLALCHTLRQHVHDWNEEELNWF